VFFRAEVLGNTSSALQFALMALAISKGEAVGGKAFGFRNGKDSCGIEATGEEDDGFFWN